MRKLFLIGSAVAVMMAAGSAGAADMPVKYKAPPPPPPTWTGFYVGANAGYAWNNPTASFAANDPAAFAVSCGGFGGSTCPPSVSFNRSGGLGGFQAGFNLQLNQNWVAGVEADFDWSSIRGTAASTFGIVPLIIPGTSTFSVNTKTDWFGTIRGRLGWLVTSQLLVYGTGGFAYGHVSENVVLATPAGANFAGGGFGFFCGAALAPTCFVGSTSRNATGWTAGGGMEFALGTGFSVKAEYLYVNLGTVAANAVTTGPIGSPASFNAWFRDDFHIVRVGINLKLN